ncbi:amidase [Microbispora sp. NEAU-D428]|uniref:amidase n=1 Tax=Microbispora sitophila TaxID=2771537 RepID=UPI0018687C92|nr:amidase [Microbispora sitophila]MBE3013793.1 amidase [Microbispora sitophila]
MTSDEDLCFTPAIDLAAAIRGRELSPVELVEAVLARIERLQPLLNCFVTVLPEEAVKAAEAAEKLVMSTPADELPTLHGVPVTVKDLEETAGVRTTFGSRHFAEYVPTCNAPIWQRLSDAGAILVGKTTTPEFGMAGVTESGLTGITNNPWDLSRTTGGSSGGAAAAVASGLAPLATGSDGGGSIRVPASMCGVVGLKATSGRIPFGSEGAGAYETVTVTGPMTRTVADAALVLDVVSGPHALDAVCLLDEGAGYLASLAAASLTGKRVAYSPDLGWGPVDPETTRVVRAAVERLASDGGAAVEQVDISLPDPYDYFEKWWGPYLSQEVDALVTEGIALADLPLQMQRFYERASRLSAGEFAHVQMVTRTQIFRAFADLFARYDLLVWPTTPMPAFPHPGPLGGPAEINGVPARWPAMENQRLTEAIAHAGCPAITVPAGFTRDGLPVGLQIAAARGADTAVLQAAAVFESIAPWAHLRPQF